MYIEKYLHGWDKIEGVLLGCLARNLNILMLGKHGTGKSSFFKFIADALKAKNPVRYQMDKENFLSMVGVPNPEDLKQGRLDYASHERSVLKADGILMDEITRAGKDNQNMVLEILEEKTVFGKPINYKFAVACANDETYQGAMKLDDALFDRFVVVIPVPTITEDGNASAEELKKIILLNLGERDINRQESDKYLAEAVELIRHRYEELWVKTNKKGECYIRDNVVEFASKFMAEVLAKVRELNKGRKDKIYISNRQIGNHFAKAIVAVSAYYSAIMDDPDYLQKGAFDVIKYSISTKFNIPIEKLTDIYDNLKSLLVDGDTVMASIKVALTTGTISEKIKCFQKSSSVIKEYFEVDELTNVIGNIINQWEEIDSPNKNNVKDLVYLTKIMDKEDLAPQLIDPIRLKIFNWSLVNGVALKILAV